MNRALLSALNWKRSIRLKMFGSIIASFVLTFLIFTFIQTYLTRVTSVIGYYLSFLSPLAIDILSLFLFVLVFLALFFLFMRRIVRYLGTLAEGLMTIAGGNLNHRVPLSGKDEMGIVAENINYMAEQLQDMMERERRVEMSKMELITHVSHDLRTPLTSIIGYLNLLRNDSYDDLEEHKRYIRNAYNKTEQLKKLVDDLFEYTRLTSGDVRLSFRTFDLAGLLDQIVTEFEPIALEQGLTVNRSWEAREIVGQADAEKLVRAVDNLLLNALKFSVKPGEIAIRLSERDDHIRFAVENQGKPITKEQEMLLFERFYKAEPSRSDSRMPPGAGLGLAIARNIVELHGGRIGLDHRDGHYSFYIELPRPSASD